MLAGWIVTEVGRQPYTVYGLLRTAQSVSPVASHAVAGSAIAIVVVYVAAFGIGFGYLLRLVSKPAQPRQQGPHPVLAERIDAGRHRERRGAPAHGGRQ
jgi:cytochrome d ubiquinol oxidase subunit I